MNPPLRSGRTILYARKSTDREDKQMLSISAQLEELRNGVVNRRGLRDVEEWTESYSARKPGRPVFSKILADVERGRVDRVICWTLDRLARNPVDAGRLTYALGEGLLKEIVTHDAVYTGTGDTKFMLQVLFGAAAKYSDDLVTNVKRGNRAVHERGRITGRPPLGYTKVRDTRFHRGAARCVPDSERFELVKGIWLDMLSGTMSVADAWRRAQERGLRGQTSKWGPAGPIAPETVHTLLRNRFYAGAVIRRNEVYRGDHEPMITMEQFERVQAMLSRRGKPRLQRHEFLYQGLLRCACGNLLIGERARGRSAYYTYYRCHRKERGRVVCRAPGPSEEQVTSDIQAFLDRVQLAKPLAEWTLSALAWWRRGKLAATADVTAELRRQATVLETRLASLTDHLLDGTIDRGDYLARKQALQIELSELRLKIEHPTQELDAWEEAIRDLVNVGREYAERFRNGDRDAKRQVLGHLVLNHTVTARKTTPALRFPYTLLEESSEVALGEKGPVLNRLPHAREVLEYETTARSASPMARGLVSWWTKLKAIRTASRGLGAARPCPLPDPSRKNGGGARAPTSDTDLAA